MSWVMTNRWKRLTVDLRPGVDGDEWDELMDAIIRELPNVSRVRLIIPEGWASDADERRPLIDTLAYVLTKRGVEVERRYRG
jgi:hypothetical protein